MQNATAEIKDGVLIIKIPVKPEGTHLGEVTVYFIIGKDGALLSTSDAESKPPVQPGQKIIESRHNPKIKLDDGTIVYGCQVWWEPIV